MKPMQTNQDTRFDDLPLFHVPRHRQVWENLAQQTQQEATNLLAQLFLNHLKTRARSGAFPFELAYRLICMFSVMGDTVVDPFLGTGTTTLAAMVAGRSSIGFEIESSLKDIIHDKIHQVVPFAKSYLNSRLDRHRQFITHRSETKGAPKYTNAQLQCPVITSQEQKLTIHHVKHLKTLSETEYEIEYVLVK